MPRSRAGFYSAADLEATRQGSTDANGVANTTLVDEAAEYLRGVATSHAVTTTASAAVSSARRGLARSRALLVDVAGLGVLAWAAFTVHTTAGLVAAGVALLLANARADRA